MECAYIDCPLKEDCDDPTLLRFRYDSIKLQPCAKCNIVFYCSGRCAQSDWFHEHQFKCKEGQKYNGERLLFEEIQRIEDSTPFIKDGIFNFMNDILNVSIDGLDSGTQITLSDIEFLKKGNNILGKGSYGEVELATHKKSGKKLAVKKIDKSSLRTQKIQATLLREVDIHKRLKHENIIRLYQSIDEEKFLFLILEYAAKGNLFYLIRNKKTLTEDEAFYFFIQTCSGLYFLHKNGLIHRDIKPENLLIDDDNILKICDFGWCVQMASDEQRSTFCGTLEYMAPEMLQNQPHNYTLDIWAIGILLYELVHGQAPFTGESPREILQKILKKTIRFSSKVSEDYKDLVLKLLQIEPQQRLPLIKVFDHPWVVKFQKKYNLQKPQRISQRKTQRTTKNSESPMAKNQPMNQLKQQNQAKQPLHQEVQNVMPMKPAIKSNQFLEKKDIIEESDFEHPDFSKKDTFSQSTISNNNNKQSIVPSHNHTNSQNQLNAIKEKEKEDVMSQASISKQSQSNHNRVLSQKDIDINESKVQSVRSNQKPEEQKSLVSTAQLLREELLSPPTAKTGQELKASIASNSADVMKELEEMLKQKKKKNKHDPYEDNIYEMCENALDDLEEFDQQFSMIQDGNKDDDSFDIVIKKQESAQQVSKYQEKQEKSDNKSQKSLNNNNGSNSPLKQLASQKYEEMKSQKALTILSPHLSEDDEINTDIRIKEQEIVSTKHELNREITNKNSGKATNQLFDYDNSIYQETEVKRLQTKETPTYERLLPPNQHRPQITILSPDGQQIMPSPQVVDSSYNVFDVMDHIQTQTFGYDNFINDRSRDLSHANKNDTTTEIRLIENSVDDRGENLATGQNYFEEIKEEDSLFIDYNQSQKSQMNQSKGSKNQAKYNQWEENNYNQYEGQLKSQNQSSYIKIVSEDVSKIDGGSLFNQKQEYQTQEQKIYYQQKNLTEQELKQTIKDKISEYSRREQQYDQDPLQNSFYSQKDNNSLFYEYKPQDQSLRQQQEQQQQEYMNQSKRSNYIQNNEQPEESYMQEEIIYGTQNTKNNSFHQSQKLVDYKQEQQNNQYNQSQYSQHSKKSSQHFQDFRGQDLSLKQQKSEQKYNQYNQSQQSFHSHKSSNHSLKQYSQEPELKWDAPPKQEDKYESIFSQPVVQQQQVEEKPIVEQKRKEQKFVALNEFTELLNNNKKEPIKKEVELVKPQEEDNWKVQQDQNKKFEQDGNKMIVQSQKVTMKQKRDNDDDYEYDEASSLKIKYDEEPTITMRPTDKNVIDYEQLRKAQLKNLSSLYDNLDIKIADQNHIKNEVKDYMKAQKNYKKQYKEGVKQIEYSRPATSTQQHLFDEFVTMGGQTRGQQEKDEYDGLWNPTRINNNYQHLKSIPTNEEQQQQWLNSRKVDKHLDLDFIPQQIAYNNYDENLAEQNKVMQQIIEEMLAINEKYNNNNNQSFMGEEEKETATPHGYTPGMGQIFPTTKQPKNELQQQTTIQLDITNERKREIDSHNNSSMNINTQSVNRKPSIVKADQQQLARDSDISKSSKNIFHKLRPTGENSIRMDSSRVDDFEPSEFKRNTLFNKQKSLEMKYGKQVVNESWHDDTEERENAEFTKLRDQMIFQYQGGDEASPEEEKEEEEYHQEDDDDYEEQQQQYPPRRRDYQYDDENNDELEVEDNEASEEDQEDQQEEEELVDEEEEDGEENGHDEDEEEDEEEEQQQEQSSVEEEEDEWGSPKQRNQIFNHARRKSKSMQKYGKKGKINDDSDDWDDNNDSSNQNPNRYRFQLMEKSKREQDDQDWGDGDSTGQRQSNKSGGGFIDSLLEIFTLGCGTNK